MLMVARISIPTPVMCGRKARVAGAWERVKAKIEIFLLRRVSRPGDSGGNFIRRVLRQRLCEEMNYTLLYTILYKGVHVLPLSSD